MAHEGNIKPLCKYILLRSLKSWTMLISDTHPPKWISALLSFCGLSERAHVHIRDLSCILESCRSCNKLHKNKEESLRRVFYSTICTIQKLLYQNTPYLLQLSVVPTIIFQEELFLLCSQPWIFFWLLKYLVNKKPHGAPV